MFSVSHPKSFFAAMEIDEDKKAKKKEQERKNKLKQKKNDAKPKPPSTIEGALQAVCSSTTT